MERLCNKLTGPKREGDETSHHVDLLHRCSILGRYKNAKSNREAPCEGDGQKLTLGRPPLLTEILPAEQHNISKQVRLQTTILPPL